MPGYFMLQVGWYLNSYTDKTSTLNALGQVRYVGGTTHTDVALELVRTSILTKNRGDRPTYENVVIVVSDGRSSDKSDTVNQATLLHTASDDVISIVIGSGKESYFTYWSLPTHTM